METTMVIASLLISAFVLLAGLRAYALIGRDGAVHYETPKAGRAARDQQKLERKLGLNKPSDQKAQVQRALKPRYGIYMSKRPTLATRNEC
jgi:hypothetical protein